VDIMRTGWLRILSILFAALALVFSGAHLLKLPHKFGNAGFVLGIQLSGRSGYRHWATMPADWETLRQRWEFAHAASALLNLSALIALLGALLGPARERTSGNTELARAMQPRRRLELQEVER
jgi:hypothetical protein